MPLNPSIAERRPFDHDIDDDVPARPDTAHPTAALIGRLLIAAIFLMSGIAKLTDTSGTVAHMTAMNIPYPDTLAIVAGVAEILGAVALIAGFLTRLGSLGLILYMIPTTLIFHAFWQYSGKEQMPQMVNFMKNLAIIGGLSALVAFGAGRFSLDHVMRRRRA